MELSIRNMIKALTYKNNPSADYVEGVIDVLNILDEYCIDIDSSGVIPKTVYEFITDDQTNFRLYYIQDNQTNNILSVIYSDGTDHFMDNIPLWILEKHVFIAENDNIRYTDEFGETDIIKGVCRLYV